MHVLVSPGPFKESLSADAAAAAIARGVGLARPDADIRLLPMCDGGTGFAERITEHASGALVTVPARDPLGRWIKATYGVISYGGVRTAVIESATAAGLALLDSRERDPSITTTLGVGDLIKHAVVQNECEAVFVGCGDSATNDGGTGMLVALGARLLDEAGADIGLGGETLTRLDRIDLAGVNPRIKRASFRVACNVTSILCGPEGTSVIYSPQKGADLEMAQRLASSLERYAHIVIAQTGVDVRYIPGGGAAGGLGSALHAFLDARLDFSMNVVREFVDLDEAISSSDLVLTGEGCIDGRTATGKVVACVALASKKYGKPVVAFTGQIGKGAYRNFFLGLDGLVPIVDGPMDLELSMRQAAELLEAAAFRTVRLIQLNNSVDA